MEQKTIRFDLSADRLLDLADAKLDEGDHLGALRLIHKSLELYGPAADEYAALADTYEEMELFELSAAAWFQYLDVCAEEEAVDGYEGLSACFYNLGNEGLASYYYKKMLSDKYVTPENNVEMGELFEHAAARPSPRMRITWPPERADYSQELDAGLRLLRKGEYDAAEKEFLKVHPDSSYYAEACNYLAVCYLLAGKTDRAEERCLAALKEKPDSVQTLSTYAAVLSELDRKEESARVALKLSALPAEEPDELYKIATVCCENGLYEAAYEKFCKLEKIVGYDRTMLYFKGVAAFRCGKVKECLASFGKLLDIRPNAAVVRYYFREVRRFAEEGGDPPETNFFCHVPEKEREKRIALLKELEKMRPAEARAYFQADGDAGELLEWCFDESDGREFELQLLAVGVALRAGQEWFVSELLLDPEVNDLVKVETVHRLCRRNKGLEFGAVIANIYRKCAFDRLEVGREKHAKFVDAYALCFARFTLLGDADAERFRLAAQAVYGALEESDSLGLVKGAESLACAVFFTAVGGGDGKEMKRVLHSMHADPHEVAAILDAVRGVFGAQAEAAAADGSKEKQEGQEENGDETH